MDFLIGYLYLTVVLNLGVKKMAFGPAGNPALYTLHKTRKLYTGSILALHTSASLRYTAAAGWPTRGQACYIYHTSATILLIFC